MTRRNSVFSNVEVEEVSVKKKAPFGVAWLIFVPVAIIALWFIGRTQGWL